MTRAGLPTVTLDHFLVSAREQLDAFEAQWRAAMQRKPEHFPNDLPEGDWWEQFQIFDTDHSLVDDAPEAAGGH